MISGVTLLNKEESIIHTYKRTLKIITDILIFSVIYLEIDSFAATGVVRNLKSILIEIVVGSNYWHLWYLFAYVALILTVPFLRDAVKGQKKESFISIFILTSILLFALPVLKMCGVALTANIQPSWLKTDIFIWPILGFFFDKYECEQLFKGRIIIPIFVGLSVLIAFSYKLQMSFLYDHPSDKNEIFIRLLSIFVAPLLFLAAKRLFKTSVSGKQSSEIAEKRKQILCEVGNQTFGIYLLHIIILWKLPKLFSLWNFLERYHYGILLSVICVFVIGYVFTKMLKKIPGIRRLL